MPPSSPGFGWGSAPSGFRLEAEVETAVACLAFDRAGDRANVGARPNEDWFHLGEAAEESNPEKAEEAYRKALAADP
jgi:Tfp pilus assembly protein PilF